jgi:hypothetical protein
MKTTKYAAEHGMAEEDARNANPRSPKAGLHQQDAEQHLRLERTVHAGILTSRIREVWQLWRIRHN